MKKIKFTPEVDKLLKKLRANMEKQLINILHLEFQSYLSKQGYNELISWYIAPRSGDRRSLYKQKYLDSFYIRLKDNTVVEIPMDEKNFKFKELYLADK
jgi:hypothetical protein